jgi:hypothetical protein
MTAMKHWVIASVACLCLAPSARAGAIDSIEDSTDAAIGWCESMAQTAAQVRAADELRAARAAIRVYAANAAPHATAAQQCEFGLQLPAHLDANRPLVVLLHGLDMDRSSLLQMADLLHKDGQQVATFGYPADGPISEDSALLGQQLAPLVAEHPTLGLNLIGYSMGSLVARDYVEGPAYAGHVRHLIMLAPPNHGSRWASFEPLIKARHDIEQSRADAQWKPSWIITEGLCEAADDLLPQSSFLAELNARPRRAGVRYTIIDGDEHVLRRLAANALTETADALAQHIAPRPATLTMELALDTAAAEVRRPHDSGDGAVSLRSAALAGVSDVVTVHADHGTLFWPDALGDAPAALPIIEQRLGR